MFYMFCFLRLKPVLPLPARMPLPAGVAGALAGIILCFAFVASAPFAPSVLSVVSVLSVASAQSVVALVNDEVITYRDLSTRTALATLASGLENTSENRASLEAAVLQEIITEMLQASQAESLDLSVTPEELDNAIDGVASRQGVPTEEFFIYLKNNDVSPETFRENILAQILWSKVVQEEYVPRITIRESEVEEELLRALSLNNERLYRLSEIFVPETGSDSQAQEAIRGLHDAILEGALFSRVAQEFSRSVTAPLGGSLGWLSASSLSEERSLALEGLRIGEVSEPIRENGGWVILWLEDIRETSGERPFNLIQMSWPAETNREEIEEVHTQLDSCRSARAASEDIGESGRELINVLLNDISDPIREVVRTLKPGVASQIYGGNGIMYQVYMLCAPDKGSPAWQSTYNRIAGARLDSFLRNLERRLRRNAQIEIRL
ncbi:MAG: peptidylprolyl isomerase [Alphaproteobacteria bacterium]